MIPERIKVDNNGDFKFYPPEHNPLHDAYDREMAKIYKFTFEEIEEAYLLAKRKRDQQNKPIKYGCHINEQINEVYDDCELDNDKHQCTFAYSLFEQGKCKTDCQYWRPIEVNK